ncbi:MAG: ThuA domain-containing protein [Bryobacteraceae bacterium]|nr:ThuA domain-containing protein [Bryobacteraceae bacterium]
MRLVALLLLLTGFVWGQTPKRILFFSHTAGFRHGSIEVAKRVLAQLSPAEFQVTSSEDLGMINAASLRNFDAIFFYTSGELALTNQQKQDLLNYVRQGGGFGGTHSATDCLYGWPEYGELIGGYFDGHPWTQRVRIDIEDPEHPIMEGVPNGFEITEEVYQFRAFSRDRVRVLMTLDPRSVNLRANGVNRTDEDFALAWVHQYGQGRVFYTALGHFDEIFTDARVQRMLRNAFRWMTRLTDGPVTPRGGATQGATPRINAVVDAAQGRFESTFSPGGIVSIYGTNLTSGSAVPGTGRSARLAGTTVRLNGQALPLYFASPGQVNVLMPREARAGALTVEAGVVRSGERAMRSQAATPGIFAVTLDRGVFVFWTTGLGELDANGRTLATPGVNVNGTNVEVLYSGIAPGFPGLYQINARPPGAGSFDGRLTIRLEIAGAETNAQLSILNP